jgi:hypothetical protein
VPTCVLQGIKPTMVEKSNNIEVYMHLLKNLKLLHQAKNDKKIMKHLLNLILISKVAVLPFAIHINLLGRQSFTWWWWIVINASKGSNS